MTRLLRFWRENWLTILIVGALLIAFVVLRTAPSDLATVQAYEEALSAGQPVVVYFYSNA